MNEVTYMAMQESAEIGKFLDALKAAVRERNEGRQLDCWPVCSFGGKDADLDAEGCTGIKDIRWSDEDHVFVDVGGHKTFCYDSEASEEQRTSDWEILCSECTGYSVDGDSEEFTAGFSAELVVPVVWRNGKLSIGHTANRIIGRARKGVAEFEQHMASVTRFLDEVGTL